RCSWRCATGASRRLSTRCSPRSPRSAASTSAPPPAPWPRASAGQRFSSSPSSSRCRASPCSGGSALASTSSTNRQLPLPRQRSGVIRAGAHPLCERGIVAQSVRRDQDPALVVRAHPLCHEDQHTLDLRIPIEPCSRLGNPARLEAKPLAECRLRIGGCLPLQNCNRRFEALKESDFLHRSALQMPRGPCGIQTSPIPV